MTGDSTNQPVDRTHPDTGDHNAARHDTGQHDTAQESSGQQRVIERARTLLPANDRILAVYPIGRHATGEADEFSDIDVHCVVTDESAP